MPGQKEALGFSLIELVTVIVILGLLAFFALPRLRIQDTTLLTSRDTIIAALFHAQQVAMARDSATNPVTFVATSNTIDVQENGVSISLPAITYPATLENGVTITSGTGVLSYTKLGKTNATTINLNAGGTTISVESSGYAH